MLGEQRSRKIASQDGGGSNDVDDGDTIGTSDVPLVTEKTSQGFQC